MSALRSMYVAPSRTVPPVPPLCCTPIVTTGFAGAWTVRGFAMFSVIERASGRWVATVPTGTTVRVPAGGVRDAYGETNGTASATVS